MPVLHREGKSHRAASLRPPAPLAPSPQVEAFVEEAASALKEAAAAAAEEASATSAAEQAASAASVSADLSQAAASLEQAAQAAQGAADTDVVEAIQSAMAAITEAAAAAQVRWPERRSGGRAAASRGRVKVAPQPAGGAELRAGSPLLSVAMCVPPLAVGTALGACRTHPALAFRRAGAGAAGDCGSGAGGEAGVLVPVHHRPRCAGRWVQGGRGMGGVAAGRRAVPGARPGAQAHWRAVAAGQECIAQVAAGTRWASAPCWQQLLSAAWGPWLACRVRAGPGGRGVHPAPAGQGGAGGGARLRRCGLGERRRGWRLPRQSVDALSARCLPA